MLFKGQLYNVFLLNVCKQYAQKMSILNRKGGIYGIIRNNISNILQVKSATLSVHWKAEHLLSIHT